MTNQPQPNELPEPVKALIETRSKASGAEPVPGAPVFLGLDEASAIFDLTTVKPAPRSWHLLKGLRSPGPVVEHGPKMSRGETAAMAQTADPSAFGANGAQPQPQLTDVDRAAIEDVLGPADADGRWVVGHDGPTTQPPATDR